VYRALEFLLQQGLAHRIASLNAFVGCAKPGHGDAGQFLICRTCGSAAELDDERIQQAIGRSARTRGFAVLHHTVEVSGLCPDCRQETGGDPPAPPE